MPTNRRRRRNAIFATIAATVLVAGFAWLNVRQPARVVVREPGLDVLLVTIDTLRADALGSYHNTTVSTPWLDRLANEGVRFERAYAHNVVTLPSHANILTGRYPFSHGVRENAGFRLSPKAETLATLLKARGYRTGAFVSAFPLDSRFGLARGFDVYDDRYGDAGLHTAFEMQERSGTATVAAATEWLASGAGTPTFGWIHLYDPHFPYRPPEPYASRYRDTPYAGEVSAVDAALAPILEPILASRGARRTLVVVTSDHGEALGEHGEKTHGIFAYDSTLRVPLFIYEPGLFKPGVVTEPVRHIDIMPTILDALALPAPQGVDGRSLLGIAAGLDAEPVISYFEALSANLNRGWAPLYGVMRGGTKYIDLPLPELYDLRSDSLEARNLVGSDPQTLRTLQALLAQYRQRDAGVAPSGESAEVRARLRALGYAAASAPRKTVFEDDDDPKRLIELEGALQEVVTRYQSGDLQGALALCEDVQRRRPDMALSLLYLAFLRREAGDLRGSIDAGRRAIALNPDDGDVMALIGVYLTEAGQQKEAAGLLEPLARSADPDLDVVNAYGVALATDGRRDDALAAFGRARAIDPSNAMALSNMATVRLMSGDVERAATEFKAAIALDPSVPKAHNSLGVIAAGNGREEEAIEWWRRAVEIDPRDYQTLYNLGHLLIKMGRADEARGYLERYVSVAPPALESADIARVRQWLGGAAPPP